MDGSQFLQYGLGVFFILIGIAANVWTWRQTKSTIVAARAQSESMRMNAAEQKRQAERSQVGTIGA